MSLNQAQTTTKQLNLTRLGDAGEFQNHWLLTTSQTKFRVHFGIKELFKPNTVQ